MTALEESSSPAPPSARVTPTRVETAHRLRDLVHTLVASDVDDATLARIGDLAGEARTLLDGAPRRTRVIPDLATIERLRAEGRAPAFDAMSDRAVAGPANPTSVVYQPRFEDDIAIADVWFGPAFEGAPGRVHGGMVAAVLDDILGAAMAQVREPGLTGRLTVHYRAPVPVGEWIVCRAWRVARSGRKLTVHAEARLGDRVLVESDALMILVDQQHFDTHALDLLARRKPED